MTAFPSVKFAIVSDMGEPARKKRNAGGRPPFPVRPTPRRPGWYGCEDRVAWLLRVNRLHGHDDRLVNETVFASAFRGGCWPDPVSSSRVSRWETGVVRAGFVVLRRYEQLLGLPPYHLVAVADWTYRQAVGRTGEPILRRGVDPADPAIHERTGQLLEQALSTGLMSGSDWDELTSYLALLPAAFLYPRTAWSQLTERLLAELLIADGLAWVWRTEALARLMAHSKARAAIIAACGSLATDPTNQVVVEPLTILDLVADADANRHVLTQLAHPVSDRALRGALLACIEKVPRQHFRPAQLRLLAETTTDLLTVSGPDAEAHMLAAALLRQIPPGQLGRAHRRLSVTTDLITRSILTFGWTMSPGVTDQIIAGLVAAATAQVPRPPHSGADPMLSLLMGELLFDPNVDNRLIAGHLIAATPYREPIGAALAAELTRRQPTQFVPLTTAILVAMQFVGRPIDRPVVERLAATTGLPVPVTDVATWVIGHVPGSSNERFWRTALNTHAHAWYRTRNPASHSALRGLVYGLGINRNYVLLREVHANSRLPWPARQAAAWWLAIPTHISASAAH